MRATKRRRKEFARTEENTHLDDPFHASARARPRCRANDRSRLVAGAGAATSHATTLIPRGNACDRRCRRSRRRPPRLQHGVEGRPVLSAVEHLPGAVPRSRRQELFRCARREAARTTRLQRRPLGPDLERPRAVARRLQRGLPRPDVGPHQPASAVRDRRAARLPPRHGERGVPGRRVSGLGDPFGRRYAGG